MIMYFREKEKNMKGVYVAVIAGGQGTRLFPLSHDGRPKQFCMLNQEDTFIQATVRRFLNLGIDPNKIIIVVTSDKQITLAKEQLLSFGVTSINIIKISSGHGYAGAMIKATEYISTIDSEAVIINTPSDQYIEEGEEFTKVVQCAVKESAKSGDPVIVGVNVSDIVTVMGCGHAIYDVCDKSKVKTVLNFIEKPNRDMSVDLLREGNFACNTGINVWKASSMRGIVNDYLAAEKSGMATDELMDKFKRIGLAIGKFRWYDCGALKSLYEISEKTPNHKNASLGGSVHRTECLESLFITIKGIDIYAAGVKGAAVVVNEISGKIVIAIINLEDSQKVRDLAEDYKKNKKFLLKDFSVGARNNRISRTNLSDSIVVGFVGTCNYTVTAIKHFDRNDGKITVIVSNDAEISEESL